MFTDARGLEITAADASAVAHFDRTIGAYLEFSRDAGSRLKEVFTADPAMPMAHVLRGTFFNLMGLPVLQPKARESAANARALYASANARERLHMDALDAWCAGEFEQATAVWETILLDYPRDVLALKLAAHLYFYRGDCAALRDTVARVLPAWGVATPGYSFLLGMHAFGLEECGDYVNAERLGRQAVEMNPADTWATHAVAHVMEMQDRRSEGVQWIEDLKPHWNACNNFRYHLWWHLAIMHFALERYDEVLALYDQCVFDPKSDEYLDLCNDVALLARLELAGIDVGNRWEALIGKIDAQRTTRILAFVDAHYLLASAAARGDGAAQPMVQELKAYASAARGSSARVTAEIGVALAEAICAHRGRRYAECVDALYGVRDRLYRIGGSHAQRDLFSLLLIDAALKAGRLSQARALAAERVALRPHNLWGWRAFLAASDALGDEHSTLAAQAAIARLAV